MDMCTTVVQCITIVKRLTLARFDRVLSYVLVADLDECRTCANTVLMTEQVDYAKEPELTLGWRIQIALDEGKLQHTDLMEKFEVSRGTVSRWCRDVGAPPKKFVLNEIAVMCRVSPRWLIDGPSRDNRPPDGDPSHLGESNSRPIHYLRTRMTRIPDLSDTLDRTG